MRAETARQRIIRSLLDAYRAGAFPMADPDTGVLELFTTDHRGVFPLEPGGFHVPRRLAQRLKSGPFRITCDTRFLEVVRACAAPREEEDNGVWISEDLIELYEMLNQAGHAHSVEATIEDPDTGEAMLAGGVFGVHIGGAFFGESMFHAPPPHGTDASKACLVHLVAHLRARGFTLFDTQLLNPFLARLGCIEILRPEYERRLAEAVELPIAWDPFEPDWRGAL